MSRSLSMEKPISNISFNFMSFYFKFRDFFSPPIKMLQPIGIQSGRVSSIIEQDSGSYTIPAPRLVGPTGTVYAARH